MEYGNFTAELFGHRQRPWGYEVRIDVTYNPTGEKKHICLTFDHTPTEQEIIDEGKRRLDKVQWKIDNPPNEALIRKEELKENILWFVDKGYLTMNQALRIKAIVEE